MENEDCETCIYTFPYWFWTCKELKSKAIPLKWKKNFLRVYSPFVMGKLEDMTLYSQDSGEVPVLDGTKKTNQYINIKQPIPFPHLNGNSVTVVVKGKKNYSESLIDPYPANSIRIDYINTEPSFDDEIFIGYFVEWLRCKTGLFWMGKIMPNMYRVNRLKFKSNFKGEQQSNGEVTANFFTLSGDEKSVCDEIWKESLVEAIQGNVPPLYMSIYHDSRFMHFTRDYRRAVLNSAIACEEALKFFAREYHVTKHPDKIFKSNKHFKGTNLTNHLDLYSKDFFGVSLKEENTALYEIIEQLWIARHSTAHSANAVIREQGKERVVTDKDSIRFIIAVKELIKWLKEVSRID